MAAQCSLLCLHLEQLRRILFGHAKLSKLDRANWVPFLPEYVVLDQCIDSNTCCYWCQCFCSIGAFFITGIRNGTTLLSSISKPTPLQWRSVNLSQTFTNLSQTWLQPCAFLAFFTSFSFSSYGECVGLRCQKSAVLWQSWVCLIDVGSHQGNTTSKTPQAMLFPHLVTLDLSDFFMRLRQTY